MKISDLEAPALVGDAEAPAALGGEVESPALGGEVVAPTLGEGPDLVGDVVLVAPAVSEDVVLECPAVAREAVVLLFAADAAIVAAMEAFVRCGLLHCFLIFRSVFIDVAGNSVPHLLEPRVLLDSVDHLSGHLLKILHDSKTMALSLSVGGERFWFRHLLQELIDCNLFLDSVHGFRNQLAERRLTQKYVMLCTDELMYMMEGFGFDFDGIYLEEIFAQRTNYAEKAHYWVQLKNDPRQPWA